MELIARELYILYCPERPTKRSAAQDRDSAASSISSARLRPRIQSGFISGYTLESGACRVSKIYPMYASHGPPGAAALSSLGSRASIASQHIKSLGRRRDVTQPPLFPLGGVVNHERDQETHAHWLPHVSGPPRQVRRAQAGL